MEAPANPFWILLHSWPTVFNRYTFGDIAINVALYMPAGFTGYLAFRRFAGKAMSVIAPVLICTAFSMSIELIQLFVPSRDCSLLDLVCDIIGSVFGVVLATMLADVFPRKPILGARGKQPEFGAVALLFCWIGSFLFPLFPVMGRTALGQKLGIFLHAPVGDPVLILTAALVWLTAGNLFQSGAFSSPRWLTVLSVAIIPAQFLVVDRQPSPATLAGALVGAVCFALFWPRRNVYRNAGTKVLAWVFLGMLIVRGLAPFEFDGPAASFSWIPFNGFLETPWQTGIQILAEKFFLYGASVWLLRAAGLRNGMATVVTAAALLGIEIAQTRLPGRTAEITDPLLAILAGFALAILARGSHSGVHGSRRRVA